VAVPMLALLYPDTNELKLALVDTSSQ
jgi:hypothetical protein